MKTETVQERLKLLGCTVIDKPTGYEGVATSVSFEVAGCVDVYVQPPSAGAELPEGKWFDYRRLTVYDRIMEFGGATGEDDGN